MIAASLVLLALVAGMAGTTWGLIREANANTALAAKNGELSIANGRVLKANADLSAANAKVEARYNLAVDAIKTFHTGVSEDFLLKEEKFKALRDRLLKSAADFYGKLGALLGKEDRTRRARRALASSNFELADLTGKVGRPEEALAAHRAVLAARESLAAAPEAGAAKVDLGQSLTAVASLLETTGRADEAVATYRRSESLLAGPAGGDPAARAALADCRSRLGSLLGNTGRLPEALTAFRQARADQQALADAPGATEAVRRDQATTLGRIAWLLSEKMGQQKEAEAEHRRALTLWQELADDHPEVLEYRYNLARACGNLGMLLSRAGKQAEAEVEYRKTGETFRKLADEYPAVTDFRRSLASLHNSRGVLLMEAGKSAEAEAEYRAALALQQELVDDHPAVEQFRVLLAYSRINLGLLLSWTRPAEAGRSSSAGRSRSFRSCPTTTPGMSFTARAWSRRPSISAKWPARSAGRPRAATSSNGRPPSWNGSLGRCRLTATNWRC